MLVPGPTLHSNPGPLGSCSPSHLPPGLASPLGAFRWELGAGSLPLFRFHLRHWLSPSASSSIVRTPKPVLPQGTAKAPEPQSNPTCQVLDYVKGKSRSKWPDYTTVPRTTRKLSQVKYPRSHGLASALCQDTGLASPLVWRAHSLLSNSPLL